MSSNVSLKSPEAMFVVGVVVLIGAVSISGWLASPPAGSIRAFLEQEETQYSQFNEELLIRHFFQDERGGIFVDVGCSLPKRGSTTYYLESELGWTGIGIDALESYGKLWEASRPNARFIHTAVSDTSGDVVTFYQAEHPGLSSLNKDWSEQFGMGEPVPVDVETITLNDLLDREGVERFDFLSMDIEGAEPLALAGFDIEQYRPRLVCIEVHSGSESEGFIREYFGTHGYERIDAYLPYDIANWYYRPKNH